MSDFILPINDNNTNLAGYSGYINIFDLSGNYQSGRPVALKNNSETLTANYLNNYFISSKPTVTNRTQYFTLTGGKYIPQNLFESTLYQQKNTDLFRNFIFNGTIVNNTLHTDYTRPYTFQAFIKAFNSGFGLLSIVYSPIDLVGNFSIQLNTTSLTNIAYLQWGFVTNGYPVYTTEANNQGSVTITNSLKNWGVVGLFTNWGGLPDVPMTETFSGSNIFVVTLNESFYGPFKFRLNSNWNYNYGGNWDTGILSASTNINNSPDINAPQLPTGYYYELTLNLNTYTFSKTIKKDYVSCLLEGTLVWTTKGYLPIESLKIGDTIENNHFYIDITKVGKWSVDLNCEENRNDISKKIYKIPAGKFGAKTDIYISHYHRILYYINPESNDEERAYDIPINLGLQPANPEEFSDNGKYNLYHLQLAVENHYVVNGECMVEAWNPNAEHF